MDKQSEQNTDRYHDIFPTTLRGLLESRPKDGKSTTYKALGEAVNVRQQTISQYASGQTQPTADVLLKIAKFFDVSVDYLLTGVSSQNETFHKALGLSDQAIDYLRRARDMYPQPDPDPDRIHTIPFLDEVLSDKDFYEFLDALYYYVEGLKVTPDRFEKKSEQFDGFDIEGYLNWQLQKFIEDFIQKEVDKYGLKTK